MSAACSGLRVIVGWGLNRRIRWLRQVGQKGGGRCGEPPGGAREQLGGVSENGVGASAPVSLAKARDEWLDVAP